MLHQAQAGSLQPTEMDMVKEQAQIAKMGADVQRQQSETARNVPEVEHLKSETILNLAKARAEGTKSVISQRIQ